jgi:phosphoglycolate phosphatase-like HAD superfamily hydrolase
MKAVVIDLDGTLTHSAKGIINSIYYTLDYYQIEKPKFEKSKFAIEKN